MFCAVKSLNVKARSEFPNVWGEYKNHSNPYIQGTTVPCDNYDDIKLLLGYYYAIYPAEIKTAEIVLLAKIQLYHNKYYTL